MLYLSGKRDRLEMRDTKPLLLLLLAIGLISTWVYHIYDKAQYSKQKTEASEDPTSAIDSSKDSLSNIYSATIANLETRPSYSITKEDSLKNRLGERLTEIRVLKNEIKGLLNKSNFSNIDLSLAKEKIATLQEKVDELNDQRTNMEEEKNQLNTVLENLTQSVDTMQRNIRRLSTENASLNEKIALASVFVASELKIEAIAVKGTSEESTSQAKKTDKFVASFVVQNRVNQFSNVELTTVLLTPDGQVMQSTVWDSGSFDTKSEGRKSFTRKIKFDYEKGEQKNLLFSIDTEKCQKGTYIFQLWHNGIKIGQATKTLS